MDIKKLQAEQLRLAKKIRIKDDFSELNTIGGCNVAYVGNKLIAIVVVLDYKTLKPIEKKFVISQPALPYILTFLSYREAPAIIEAFNLLETKPDVLMFDSHGILHPRRIGSASHIGLLIDTPSIGVARKMQCGEIVGDKVLVNGELRASVIKTREHANPLYVSPGHKISMKTCVEIVKKCSRQESKLPEPLRQAHKFGLKIKKEFKEKTYQPMLASF